MRELRRGALLLGFLTLVAVTLAFSTVTGSAAGSLRVANQQAADVELALSISPSSIEPGQEATVSVLLKNPSLGPVAPEVKLTLPASVSTKLQELPASTIYNAQNGTINWQPVIAGNGAEAQLLLTVVALVADVSTPEQTMTAAVRVGDRVISQDARFWIGLTPAASIRPNPPQVSVGQPIQLVGTITGPGPVDQIWSLGDGRIVEAQDPVVVYPAPGQYEVTLQASGPVGIITARSIVTVIAQPLARFTIPDSTPAVGDSVFFMNESGGQQPLAYLWDFGDGETSSEINPVHNYSTAGAYNVRLLLSGPNGESEVAQSIVVGHPPIADIVIGEVADAGSIVQAQAFTDDTITSIKWDMGDGRGHEGNLIEHVYWSAGDYLVMVSVANEFGETLVQREVRINPGPLLFYLPLVRAPGPDIIDPQITTEEPEILIIEEQLSLLDLPEELGPAEQLYAYINEARRINGLPPLTLVPELSVAAQTHANDMAASGFTSHTGSNGTVPAHRLQLSGYPGGYAGEATAWGMAHPAEPVRFWLTSPGHRPILLDPAATEVGVGYSENFSAPSIWYWTAEFASMNLPVIRLPLPETFVEAAPPVIELLGPPKDSEFTLSPETNLIFTWSWPQPLEPDERFALYLNAQGRTTQLGTVTQPQSEGQYQFAISAGNVPVSPGRQQWSVRLENTLEGTMRDESQSWPISFLSLP